MLVAVARLIVIAVTIVRVAHVTTVGCIGIVCGVFVLMVFIYWRSMHTCFIARCEREWIALITSVILRSSITEAPWAARSPITIIDFRIVVVTFRGARSFARAR